MGFLLVLMVGGLAFLAGVQVWAFTGSIPLAMGYGFFIMAVLGWLYRRYFRRRGVRFVGEVHQEVDEANFTTVVKDEFDARARVQQRVQGKSAQVANTIRSMLVEDVSGQRRVKGGK